MKTIIFLQCSYRPSQLINLKDNLIFNSNTPWSAQILVQLRLLWSRSGGEMGQIKSKPIFKSCELYWCKIGSDFWTDRQTPSGSTTKTMTISMLVTDVGDKMCWRQPWDVCHSFGFFRLQYPLSFNITNVTLASDNIQRMSPISKFCHQHPKIVTKIKSPTSACHQHLSSHDIIFKLRSSQY